MLGPWICKSQLIGLWLASEDMSITADGPMIGTLICQLQLIGLWLASEVMSITADWPVIGIWRYVNHSWWAYARHLNMSITADWSVISIWRYVNHSWWAYARHLQICQLQLMGLWLVSKDLADHNWWVYARNLKISQSQLIYAWNLKIKHVNGQNSTSFFGKLLEHYIVTAVLQEVNGKKGSHVVLMLVLAHGNYRVTGGAWLGRHPCCPYTVLIHSTLNCRVTGGVW